MCPLRKPNINYFRGWFFVTMRGAKDQSVLGVIDDKRQRSLEFRRAQPPEDLVQYSQRAPVNLRHESVSLKVRGLSFASRRK